ncbi:MAG TPA: cytochrome c3 family protein, partial [Gemmatimonadaceae bacterium]|nr:cytochrome c3 family protein [Gemmatimonadaceae bacterium]
HAMVAANDPLWFRGVVTECGECHQRLTETYYKSYHGKATELGHDIAAKCSDCHTPHAMLEAKDTLSSVHARNLPTTCGKCHEGANANFVQYLSHADPQDREKNAIVYWVWVGMTTLLASVLTFMGSHSLLWFLRARREGPHGGHGGHGGPDERGAEGTAG